MGGRGSKFNLKINKNKGKLVDKIDITDKKIIQSYCEDTLNYLAGVAEVEECVIITEDGKVYHFVGDKYTVSIPDKYNRIAKYDLHSHPHDTARSFSKQDISSWKVGCEYFLTDGKYDYRVSLIKPILYNKNLYSESLEFAIKNDIKNDDDQHIQCLYLQHKGFIKYERLERNS